MVASRMGAWTRDRGEPVKSATVLLQNDQGQILAVSRGKDTRDWGMPGGWIEPDEDPAQAAARELYEETGIIVKPEDLRAIYFQAGCMTFTPDGPIQMPKGRLFSEPFEGYVDWVEPAAIACPACSFGPTNQRMLIDLGLL